MHQNYKNKILEQLEIQYKIKLFTEKATILNKINSSMEKLIYQKFRIKT